jgi:four helix bundle protein
MKYKRFEDLPVWKDAIEFAVKVFEFTTRAKSEFQGLGDLKNQLERASVSISNNIAEGFERGTNKELIQYIYIAKGSVGECRSMTYIFGHLKSFRKFKEDILDLRRRAEIIAKQLNGWADSLKNSDIKGAKFLTDKERESYERRRDLEEFDAEMTQFRKEFKEKLESGTFYDKD